MCLAAPVRVLEKPKDNVARVEMDGVKLDISTDLFPDLKVGDYILVHAGFAIERISEEEAKEKLESFDEYYDSLDNA